MEQSIMILNSFDDQELSVFNIGKKQVVSEMNFFMDTNRVKDDPNLHEIKNENIRGEQPERFQLELSTGLNLGTTSEKSVVDNIGSPEVAKQKNSNKNEMQSMILKAELDRMNTENERLRAILNQINDKYHSLQMHIMELLPHQLNNTSNINEMNYDKGIPEEEKGKILFNPTKSMKDKEESNQDCSISPACTEEMTSSMASHGRKSNIKTEIIREKSFAEWNPKKLQKVDHNSSGKGINIDHESSEATIKKVRVSVRARSEAPMISDGCQWRKYGQKIAKGNPCPRAYYRCTMGVACPVRKQVQRCFEDRSVLVTTYEGCHNHPLPPAAIAMASATSAAASMLLSGSTTSSDSLLNSNLMSRNPFPYPQHLASLSASAPFPTITLDLTTNNNNPLYPFIHRPQPQAPFPIQNQHQAQFLMNNFVPQSEEIVNAIAADPNFTAALAAAISSIIGNAG